MNGITRLFDDLSRALAGAGFGQVAITGTVSKLVQSSSGHVYFMLEDSQSKIRCMMPRGVAQKVKLASGETVSLIGSVTIYGPKGDMQFVVTCLAT